MNPDFEDLHAAWLGRRELTADRREALLRRLREDSAFRAEFAEDIQMAGMTRAVQAAEPRWLDLEDRLAPAANAKSSSFEDRVTAEWSRIEAHRNALPWLRWLGFSFAALAIWVITGVTAFRAGKSAHSPAVASAPVPRPAPLTSPEPGVAPVAVLSRIVTTRGTTEADQQAGAPLPPGAFVLPEGLAQLDFVGGARMIVRGPARMELASGGAARLLSGAATCSIDAPGRFFQLSTPGGSVLKSDGAFGLNVTNGRTVFHAISGALTVEDAAGRARELAEASAVRLAGEAFEPAEYEPAFFPSLTEIRRMEAEAVANRSVDWWERAQQWSRDSDTLLHYTFMSDVYHERRVENHASDAVADSHGIVVGAKWTEGRWPWKKALEFRRRTDRVLLGLAGRHERLTLAAWLRVDAFTQPQNVLLRSKHPERREGENAALTKAERQRGEIRWVIDRSGVVRFKVATGSPRGGEEWDSAATPRLFKDDAIGQWVLLAVTYDAPTGEVTHYWNGQPVAKSLMSNAAALSFDYLELGNPGPSGQEALNGDRYGFFGSLDELIVSRRVLAPREIAELHAVGRPSS